MELFLPDNLSKPQIHFREYTGSTDTFLKVLNHYFKNPEIVQIAQVDRAEVQTRNYKILVQYGLEKRTVLLKHYIVSANREQIEFYLNFVTILGRSGVAVSNVISALDGRLTVEVNELYSLFDFIDADHFSPTEEALGKVAASLATLHNAFNKFDGEYVKRIDTLSQAGYYPFNITKKYSVQDIFTYEEKIRHSVQYQEKGQKVLERLTSFKQAVAEVEKNNAEIAALPEGLIHSDFHPHNILMNEGNVRAILDFENVRVSQQAREAAFAIYKFGRQFLSHMMAESDRQAKAQRLRNLFISHYSKIRPLSEKEIELMPFLAKDTFIRKLLFALKDVYDENKAIWLNDLPKHSVAIDEINYFWP